MAKQLLSSALQEQKELEGSHQQFHPASKCSSIAGFRSLASIPNNEGFLAKYQASGLLILLKIGNLPFFRCFSKANQSNLTPKVSVQQAGKARSRPITRISSYASSNDDYCLPHVTQWSNCFTVEGSQMTLSMTIDSSTCRQFLESCLLACWRPPPKNFSNRFESFSQSFRTCHFASSK